MYKSYFDLKSSPFKLTPDTHCFFSEGNRKAILDALLYAVNDGAGIIKVVGEVGSGKTLLSRLLGQSLPPSFEILYLLNPRIPPDKILYAIALELGLGNDNGIDKVSLLHLLHNKLLQLHQQGRQTVLLIDEAQAIPVASLEEIRMLSNLETGSNKLLQIVLFGQPELDQHLNRHEVRQIRERIIHNFYLPRLSSGEVGRYLDFRLQHAGYQGAFLFSGMAVRIITWKADGFLRRINILAEKCLLAAFAKQSKKVTGLIALQAELDQRTRRGRLIFFSIIAALGTGLSVNLVHNQDNELQVPVVPKPAKETTVLQPQTQVDRMPTAPAQASPTPAVDNANGYSIQLLRVTVADRQRLNHELFNLIPTDLQFQVFAHLIGLSTYQVFLGVFDNYAAAEKRLQLLPPPLRNNRPFIIKQSEINKKYNGLAVFLKK
jgi:type II secretory pathway predicted ATPase ExeA